MMIDTEIDVLVPDTQAYAMWNDFEALPRYFRTVRRVERLDGADRMRWTVDILGVERSFDVVVSERIPGKRIAWSTVEGTEHAGVVTFHRLDDGSCRVKLQMDFQPEGMAEQLADKLRIAKLAVDYELGEFKAVAEDAAARA